MLWTIGVMFGVLGVSFAGMYTPRTLLDIRFPLVPWWNAGWTLLVPWWTLLENFPSANERSGHAYAEGDSDHKAFGLIRLQMSVTLRPLGAGVAVPATRPLPPQVGHISGS